MLLDALWIVLLGMAIIFATLAILLLVIFLLNKLLRPKEEGEEEAYNKGASPKLQLEEEKEMVALFSALYSWLPNLEGAAGKYTLQLGSKKRDLQIEHLDERIVIRVNGKRLEVRFVQES